MKKRTNKIVRSFASAALAVTAFFGVGTLNVFADGTTGAQELSTSALLLNVAANEIVTPAGEATLTAGKTDKLSGLLIKPDSHTEAWDVDLNATFKDNASITYFLPNQFGSNNDFVANGFSVKNALGEVVATYVIGATHWASYSTGKAYVYNALTDTYTATVSAWNKTLNINEVGTLVTLTPNTEAKFMGLSGLTDDMYVAPKVGTQIPKDVALDKDSVFGTVYFEYANGVLDIKTTTFDLTGRDSASKNATGNGATLLMGSVEVDLSDGYTIEMGSAPTVYISEEDSYTAPYSSSILISSINGADVSQKTISSINGDVTAIEYENERTVGGKNVIYTREGKELDRFAVYGKFLAGGVLMSKSSAEIYRVSASESFANKTPGEYPLTVKAGALTKEYTVVIQEEYDVPSSSVLTSVDNAKIETEKVAGDYKGLSIDRVTAGNKARTAKINGTFQKNASITYLFNGSVASNTEAHGFTVYDINGNKVADAVQYYVQAWQGAGSRMYLYNALTGEYTKPKKEGGYEAMTVLESSMYSGVNVAPIPYTTYENINYDGTYYDVDTAAGTLYFEYDDNAKTLTVKVSTPQKTNLNLEEERNYKKDADGNVILDGAGNPVYKTENLASPNPIVTVGVIENVDLSKGYTIELNDPADFKEGDNQFTSNSAPIILININGVVVAEANTKAVAGKIFEAEHLKESYRFDDGDVFYLAQNGSFDGLKVKANEEFSANWKVEVCSESVIITGNYDLSKVGEYDVTLTFEQGGIPYERKGKLVVEASAKVRFDVDGGLPIPSVYLSEHSWQHEIPTPERFGWVFTGWYDGSKKVTEITKDMGAVTLKAGWLDEVAPTLSLNGFDQLTVVDKKSDFVLSATDVIAEDMAWGLLTGEAIEIFVKEPNATEFVPYGQYTFSGSKFGEYQVKYVATDGSQNSAEIQRTIKYMPVRPVLTVDGEVTASGFTEQEISLPTATAKSGEKEIAVTLSVVCNNERVELNDNAFTPLEAGVYSVTYSATDENGLVAVKTFEINVTSDTEAPVISVDFTTTEIAVGETLTLPTATATDDTDENVQISVAVKKGSETIATQSTVLNEVGIYTVVYTATDISGKQSSLTFEVFVKEEESKKGQTQDGNGSAGCKSSVSASVCGSMLMLLGAAVYLKKKNKR